MLIAVALAFSLRSETFAPNARVPQTMAASDCGGKNLAPELHWTGVPERARSLAIVMHDPDAPRSGGFDHWILYDVPASATHLEAAQQLSGHQTGTNATGSAGYYGPCPPPGSVHHYVITLYALDRMLRPASPLDAAALAQRMRGHVMARTTLIGTYER